MAGFFLKEITIIGSILAILLLAQSGACAMQGEPLINGTGIFVSTQENWDFYQGYSITVKSVNRESKEAWVKLSLNDELIQETILSEGETLNYSREYEILNLTLDSIYSNPGGELVTFKPVYQYIDLELPDPIFEDEDHSSTNENNEINNDTSTRSIDGFEMIWASLAVLLAVTYYRREQDSNRG